MERLKIPWGVQYELARGVLAEKWSWDDVTVRRLEQLCGSNANAAQVNRVMSGATSGTSAVTVPQTDLW
jgi:RNA-dependent RNA polymerase